MEYTLESSRFEVIKFQLFPLSMDCQAPAVAEPA